jgi:hypothetical protein
MYNDRVISKIYQINSDIISVISLIVLQLYLHHNSRSLYIIGRNIQQCNTEVCASLPWNLSIKGMTVGCGLRFLQLQVIKLERKEIPINAQNLVKE